MNQHEVSSTDKCSKCHWGSISYFLLGFSVLLLLAMFGMFVVVIPSFIRIFQDMGENLPTLTRIVISIAYLPKFVLISLALGPAAAMIVKEVWLRPRTNHIINFAVTVILLLVFLALAVCLLLPMVTIYQEVPVHR